MIIVVLGESGLPLDHVAYVEPRDHHRLVQRIRRRSVHGVVIVVADVAHYESEPVIAACRSSGVPVSRCQRPTRTQLRRSVEEIRERINKTTEVTT